MKAVTVLGEIDADKLGITLPHEHLLIDLRNQYTEPRDEVKKHLGLRPISEDTIGILRRDPYALVDNLLLDDVECAVAEVQKFKDAGGQTIVECTSKGLNPQPNDLAEISRRTGVNIIAGCGYYTEDTHPGNMNELSVEEIADEMVRDLTEGISGTSIRAGVIGELGTSKTIQLNELKVLKAAAKAFQIIPAAIYVHTYPWGREGISAAQYLINGNVNPSRIVVCHIDVSFELSYLKELLKMGVCIEFDDFGKEFQPNVPETGFAGGKFASDKE